MTAGMYLVNIDLRMPEHGIRKGGAPKRIEVRMRLPFVPTENLVIQAQGPYVGDTACIHLTDVRWLAQRMDDGMFTCKGDAAKMPTMTSKRAIRVFKMIGCVVIEK